MPSERILITREGEAFYVRDLGRDYHTKHGFVKKEILGIAKPGTKITTNTGKEFFVLEPGFTDLYKRIKRAPQIMLTKDLAVIISETGINNKSRIIDAGSGSGASACFLGNIAKEVSTYEIRKEFARVADENVKFLGLGSVTIKVKDIYKGIDEKETDLIVLDLPEPWKVLRHAEKSLKAGGFIVAYLPQITQVLEFVQALKKSKKIMYAKTSETIQREWVFEDKIARPGNIRIGHTGFLVFGRKISK